MLYDSWEEWTGHEQWAHQQRIWRCSEHPQHEYVALASYKDHVKTYHAASMHQLLSTELLNNQESVSQVCDRPCPFCQREFERSVDLQQHITGHLESTALLSLPNLDAIDENTEAGQINSNSANRNHADSRAGDFDRAEPLDFLENDHSGNSPAMTEIYNELFGLKLRVESISFDSMNEVNVEARQAYSSGLAEEWLSRQPRELDKEGVALGTSISSLERERSADDQVTTVIPASFEMTGSAEPRIQLNPRVALPVLQPPDSIHWLFSVFNSSVFNSSAFNQSLTTGQPSVCFGARMPGCMASLDEHRYISLIELIFESGDLVVRLYYRPEDGKSRFFCRTIPSAHLEQDTDLPLTSLIVSTRGLFIKFYDTGQEPATLWACLKFPTHEGIFIKLLYLGLSLE